MKKTALFTILMVVIIACSKNEESPIGDTDTPPTDKPAVKLYYSEDVYLDLGYMYTDSLEKSFLLANYDSGLTGTPAGIAYNHAGKRLYIVESDNNRVLRISPEDTKKIKLVYDSDNGVLYPTSVAIDTVSKKVYWANSGTKQIMSGDLFGDPNAVTTLYNGAEVFELSYGIAIDHKNNKLYIGDNNKHQILLGNLDGTGTPTVLYNNTEEMPVCPKSLVLSYKTLYWADDCNNTIVSAPADGKGPVTILFDYDNDGVSLPNGIAVDYASKKIYWSDYDASVISRGNLDGTGTSETILSGVSANSVALQLK